MTVDIYADEMLFINFVSNFFIIEITKRIIKAKTRLLKESIVSFVFSVIYTVIVISGLRVYINIFSMLVLNTAEIIILFRPVETKQYIRYGVAFKIASLCTNGVLFALSGYLKNSFNYIILMFSFCITYLSYCIINIFDSSIEYYPINIKCSNKTINVKALVDTGNSLIEPISKKPVIVAEYRAIKEVLPLKLVDIYERKKESNLMEIISAISEDSFCFSLRIIPFKSVGKERGMMLGFVADSVKINNNVINKPVIGICRFNLSKRGLYGALISPEHLGGI